MHSSKFNSIRALALAAVLVFPSVGWSNAVEETPSALAMSADALFVRPMMLVTTVLGGAIFVVSSPFSGLGGNIGESWNVLVEQPFATTFVRCLGCTMNGRKVSTVVEQSAE